MSTRSMITVRAKADFPCRYTCLYCGTVNDDVLHFESVDSKEVDSALRKDHVKDLKDAETELYNQRIKSFNDSIEMNKLAVKRFEEFWKSCADNVQPKEKYCFSVKAGYEFKCRHCRKNQPYDNSKYKAKLGPVSMLTGMVALLGLLLAIMMFLVSFSRPGDAVLFRTIALVSGIIGLVALAIFIPTGKKVRSEEAKAQFEELRGIPFDPSKLPCFDK